MGDSFEQGISGSEILFAESENSYDFTGLLNSNYAHTVVELIHRFGFSCTT